MSREVQTVQRHALSSDAVEKLREGLATCRAKRGLTPEAREAIKGLCVEARREGWAPEELLIAVKDACYASPEIAHMTTTSERDAFLAKVVTACIQEFFRTSHHD